MKVSKMTNAKLAETVDEFANAFHNDSDKSIMREVAARLRRPTPVDDDLLKMAKDLDAKDAEIAKLRTLTTHTDNSEVIAELQRRLKVAKDALDSAWMYASKLPHQWPLPERVRAKMKNALAAIRGEGGAK